MTQALESFTKSIELNPEYADAYRHRAIVYFALNRYDKGREDCKKALVINPEDEYAAYMLKATEPRQ